MLELLAIEGAVVTVDAMGCQRGIAQNIIDKKADYVLALKGNQGTLRDDVELFAGEQKAVAFKNTSVSQDTTVDGDHGRIETRTITVFHDIGWLQDNHQWPGLKSVVMVESERETDGKVETETRFYITSLALLANALGPMIRSHWMIENGLHWVLDMIFRDDECRVRTDNAPFNLAIIKHITLNVLRTGKSKDLLRMRRKVAAWDENALRPHRRLHRRMTRSVDSPAYWRLARHLGAGPVSMARLLYGERGRDFKAAVWGDSNAVTILHRRSASIQLAWERHDSTVRPALFHELHPA